MNKIMKSALAAVAGSLAVSSASAASTGFAYYVLSPAKASFTITLSGECSGKITKTVTNVGYYVNYDHDGSEVDRDGAYQMLWFHTDDSGISAYANNNISAPGETVIQTVKKGKLTLASNIKNNVSSYFDEIHNGDYDGSIRCKSGQTLS